MTIGQRIKRKRIELGLSADELAEATGKSRATIFRYENGDIASLPISVLEPIATALRTTPGYLMGWEDEIVNTQIPMSESSNIGAVFAKNIFNIPLYESVSAGFGAYANDSIVEYIPLYFSNKNEATESLCIKVKGDSMFPKIEDGDIILVHRQDSVDSGDVAVLLIDKEEGVVKKVIYDDAHYELHSFNPMYPIRNFFGEEVLRISVVGKVKKIIKEL